MRRTVLLTGIFEHYLDLEGEDSVFYPYEALFNRWGPLWVGCNTRATTLSKSHIALTRPCR